MKKQVENVKKLNISNSNIEGILDLERCAF